MIECIIQARMGSSRLPGKTLMKLDETETTLDFVINQLSFSKLIDRIVIATTSLDEDNVIEKKAKQLIIIVDEGKIVEKLGRGFLPVEVSTEDHKKTASEIEKLGCKAELRVETNEEPFLTDNQNYIYHCLFEKGIDDPHVLDKSLLRIDGVKDTGLFLNMANKIIIGNTDSFRIME